MAGTTQRSHSHNHSNCSKRSRCSIPRHQPSNSSSHHSCCLSSHNSSSRALDMTGRHPRPPAAHLLHLRIPPCSCSCNHSSSRSRLTLATLLRKALMGTPMSRAQPTGSGARGLSPKVPSPLQEVTTCGPARVRGPPPSMPRAWLLTAGPRSNSPAANRPHQWTPGLPTGARKPHPFHQMQLPRPPTAGRVHSPRQPIPMAGSTPSGLTRPACPPHPTGGPQDPLPPPARRPRTRLPTPCPMASVPGWSPTRPATTPCPTQPSRVAARPPGWPRAKAGKTRWTSRTCQAAGFRRRPARARAGPHPGMPTPVRGTANRTGPRPTRWARTAGGSQDPRWEMPCMVRR
mmetsp:Transcript_24124/g.43498  ORF Transcript_24124/g.43498 Transcript_24124/m.43498 type:complete len:345 (+) Transcript_24124:401-1435(+)